MRKVEQKIRVNEQKYESALTTALKVLSVPKGYEVKGISSGKHNELDIWIFRYEKSNGENNGLGGEHYSFTVDKDNHEILGVTWIDQRFASGQQLPSEIRTEEVAKAFFNQIEPSLFDHLENHWIRLHNEVLTKKDKKLTITGMKYKCYLPDEDTWAWVVVGPDEEIITFERGIKWEGCRVTEKWLYDNWLKESRVNMLNS
ncbi:hypothetical protein ACLM5H_24090 [Fredinandcohnia humi]